MARENVETPEVEEKDVQEVRCSVSGLPISSIPSWYANVDVKFVSDAARNKSGAAPRPAEIVEDEPAPVIADEISLEDAEEELVVDDLDIELDDAELEEEAPEEV